LPFKTTSKTSPVEEKCSKNNTSPGPCQNKNPIFAVRSMKGLDCA
jgi:hypothetical protein